ncbi:precorrin-2 dehydrogenase/sirohydrochlorin ferrochelatase family protein [Fuchsiella alkaliacetigena]|uniref:precorrin-2 dehydrogenase/sirohydrochlorin ferrochelatase family protein n=1 Tax=Fuchsiella alkaliacetigena TaxID=957042 RepID=UPI00200AFA21|nr:bifunctional precorrin-2 dehydrogenase/sirohydrochlorin ferrochelatase [Fuchsiella alkaliacetigena]MCK8824444.1 bifunctional precorrin-2 dehydrogenase/sirohydrochlorin ferrochelatase [Fuchsiella alkaliacetigena]
MGQDYLIALDLTEEQVIVVGGGTVAVRKVKSLIESEATVKVISPQLNSQLAELVAEGLIAYEKREYKSKDVEAGFLIIAATDQAKVNKQVAQDARAAGKLVNVVDQPQLSNFNVPAVVRQGDLTISISTAGKSPALSGKLRRELQARYGQEYKIFLNLLGDLRSKIINQVATAEQRRKIFKDLAYSQVPELLKVEKFKKAEELINGILPSGIGVEFLESGKYIVSFK